MRRAVVALLAPAVVGAQAPSAWVAVPRAEVVAVSPDGVRLATVHRIPADTAWAYRVTLSDAEGRAAQVIGTGQRPAWSPDGQRLAVVDADAVRIIGADGVRVASHRIAERIPVAVRWSRDGRAMAVLTEPSAGGPWTGTGLADRRQLWLLDPSSGAARLLLPSGFRLGVDDPATDRVLPFDWLPDGRLIVAGRAPDAAFARDGAVLYLADTLGSAPRYLVGEGGRWHAPIVSPDGKQVAFIGHPLSAAGYSGEELLVMRVEGTNLVRLTAGSDRDVADVQWTPDGKQLWFVAEERGSRNLFRIAAKGGRIEAMTSGVHLLALHAISRQNVAYITRTTHAAPPVVVRFPLGKPYQFTELLRDSEPPAMTAEVDELEVAGPNGVMLYGWLLRPASFDPSRRLPLLVDLHGGPHAMAGAGYDPTALAHAHNGWLVLRPNPRGSTGFGSDHATALARRWPGLDVEDVLALVADLTARGFVDSTRIAIAGTGAGSVLAASVLARMPTASAAILRCAGDGWLFGGRRDSSPWSAWSSARPFRMDPVGWLAGGALAAGSFVRAPLLVREGASTTPRIVEFAETFAAVVARTGTPVRVVRSAPGCADGPTAEGNHLLNELAWLAQPGGR